MTQVAVVAPVARFPDRVAVVAGAMLGMMLANVPAVPFGEAMARKVPQHGIALLVFAVPGLLAFLDVGEVF